MKRDDAKKTVEHLMLSVQRMRSNAAQDLPRSAFETLQGADKPKQVVQALMPYLFDESNNYLPTLVTMLDRPEALTPQAVYNVVLVATELEPIIGLGVDLMFFDDWYHLPTPKDIMPNVAKGEWDDA